MIRRARIAAVLGAALAIALPAQALGQAAVGDGSAASEYGDYVPTTTGHTSTQHHSSSGSHTTLRHTYTPPVQHTYTPPVRHTYTAPVHSTPTYSAPATSSAAPARPKHHRHHRSHPAHAAAKPHPAAKAHPKAAVTVPASSPAASVDGGSHQLVLLGLAMLTMTVAVFLRAGLRRRHGSI